MKDEFYYCTLPRNIARERGIRFYITHKRCPKGHNSVRFTSAAQCYECREAYREEIKDQERERNRKRYTKNRDRYIERIREYHQNNKDTEEYKNKRKAIRQRDRDKITDYMRKRRASDPATRLADSMRNNLNRCLTMAGGRKSGATSSTLGYSPHQLKEAIESRFLCGMSWDNRSEWHIDHIKPVSAFLAEGVTDPAVINSLDNLQPLWAEDNLRKGSKWDSEEDQQS